MHVFDANALIAWLRNEQGADEVRKLLLTSPTCMAHAINYCEVFYDMMRVEGEEAAQKAIDDLQEVGVAYRDDMDMALCQEAGHIKAVFKRVSLADCFAMALTKQEGAVLVTSDHLIIKPTAKSQQLKQLSKSSSQVVVTKPISSEISSAKSTN